MTAKRKRSIHSKKNELVEKSREAALTAVGVFNNPLVRFKSETFIVLMVIAWTYLLHAYYRDSGIEYRYYKLKTKRRRFDTTKSGAHKYWELRRCLDEEKSPIDKDTANNLRFLIGLRDEIEHQMTSRIDGHLSAKFQACAINYNEYVKKLFGSSRGIDQHLAVSLQFAAIGERQLGSIPEDGMPGHIKTFIEGFEGKLSEEEYNSPRFAYRVLFVAKTANSKGQADRVIEFVKSDSDLASKVNAAYTVIKETERPKHLPKNIVAQLRKEGYSKFGMTQHTDFWKAENAKDPAKGFGVQVLNTWYWYDRWLDHVRLHCQANASKYQ